MRHSSWMSSSSQAFCYGIPFFLCMVHLALGKFDRLPMACVLAIWLGYGVVYILVSFYERYSAPMVPIRGLCIALGLQSL
jgi:multidrug transporter EmrE-like cation transporter